MISFQANYVDSAKVKRVNVSGLADKEISFVEIDPSSYNDRISVNKTAIRWDKNGGEGFAYDICKAVNRFYDPKFVHRDDRFFVLTTQRDRFEYLKPKEILALTHVRKFNNDAQFVEYLQVNPRNLAKNRKADFREVGRAVLDLLKKLFSSKDIILNAVKGTHKFYLKNGFEIVPNVIEVIPKGEKRMIWRAVKRR